MKTIKSENLKRGDKIGIISPSRNTLENNKDIQKSIAILKGHGFNIVLGGCFLKKYGVSAGTKTERAKEINSMFKDDKIKAILCSIGGDSANQILDLIDYKLIAKNPKPILGYSDNTHLILAINSKTGLTTYHGPNLSNFSKTDKQSQDQLIDTLTQEKTIDLSSEYKIIKPGKASGALIGGNLFVINALSKTEFSPDYKNKILFWEEIDENLNAVEYQLHQLHLSGVLEKISGIIIGHIHKTKQSESTPVKQIILDLTKKYKYPIIKADCFGHFSKRFLTFPIGGKALIDTKQNKLLIEK